MMSRHRGPRAFGAWSAGAVSSLRRISISGARWLGRVVARPISARQADGTDLHPDHRGDFSRIEPCARPNSAKLSGHER